MKVHTKESQSKLTPSTALQILEEGNRRFMSNSKINRDLLEQVNGTKKGQFPFAIVLSCIDSRVPVELIFDQGIGHIFNVKIAGNFVNEDILGSMEFACKVAGSKLIVVLGHSSCGAVKGACDDVKLGNLTSLLSKIKPAINLVEETGERSSANAEYVQNVADKNVEVAIEQIKLLSPILNEMLKEKEIDIVGGMYSVDTGEVVFSNNN